MSDIKRSWHDGVPSDRTRRRDRPSDRRQLSRRALPW